MMRWGKGKIGYILIRFPALRETFVLNEIVKLSQLGVPLEIFSLSRPDQGDLNKINLHEFKNTSIYPSLSQISVWLANMYYAFKNTRTYFKAFFFVLKMTYLKPGDLFKSIYVFILSCGIAKKASNLQIRHMHCHFASHASLSALIVSRLTGITFSMTVHAYDLFKARKYLENLFEESEWVAAISNFNREWIHKRFEGKFDDKVHVIHCGIDLTRFQFEGGIKTQNIPFTLLYVAGLVPPKGHSVLFQAVSLLRKRGIHLKCVLIGDGVLGVPLKKKVEELGLESEIIFLGSLSQSDVLSWLRKADCFVMPSVPTGGNNMDGIPVVLMEALACGVPVIASRLSGIPELIIDRETGLLAEPGNAEELAEKIVLIKNGLDILDNIRKEGRRKVENEFNLEKNAARITALLSKNG